MEKKQKGKIHYGDYQLLGAMLDTSSCAARMRYKRGDKAALKAMKAIQENRQQLVVDYRNGLEPDDTL